MILECGQCHTRYQIPEGAIGPEGRMVRCANCKYSWFQAPAALDLTMAADDPRQSPAPRPEPAPIAEPPPRFEEAPAAIMADTPADIAEDAPGFAPFAEAPVPVSRSHGWTVAAVIAGISMLLGAAAILYWSAPGLAAQWGIRLGATETPLLFSDKNVALKTMANGSRLFMVSGKVLNATQARQHVPDIRVALTDAQDHIVYSWRITPATRQLDPQASIAFNGAKVDVPPSARMVHLSFADEIGE